MRVLIAFDKFKDALGAGGACEGVAAALRASHPEWKLDLCPLTDGGEEFCETLGRSVGARLEPVAVSGPRGEPLVASVGFAPGAALTPAARERLGASIQGIFAIAGLASASGLEKVPRDRRDPWKASTFGTGELLRHAAHEKAASILLGIGGSATNDLGCGALAALGFQFLDEEDKPVAIPTPETWERIKHIDRRHATALPPLFIACDVTNPLLGPNGATHTFGPQKGLRPEDRPRLESAAARMAGLLCDACGRPRMLADTPGAGAAGGISFGLMVACGAKLVSGFDLVSDWLDLPARLAAADLVLTGEGRFDATSLAGKGPGSLVTAARNLGKAVHVFAGAVELPESTGVKAHAITPQGMPLADALPRTAELLAAAVRRVF